MRKRKGSVEMDATSKDYIAIVQCYIVKERCSGYLCERSFHERTGGFAPYPSDAPIRTLNITCGGCCGKALHRKLVDLVRTIEKREGIGKERIAVQLSSCITKDNYHSPPCPHLDFLRQLIAKLELDTMDDTHISGSAEGRRRLGVYESGDGDGRNSHPEE